jgi:glyoxylase-like metal-dependent hydrolase (beta-lactamase superfamily II)
MSMSSLSRRTFVAAGAAAGAATLTGLEFTAPARAAAPLSGKPSGGFYRRKLGEFEVTSVYDGIWLRDADAGFVRNAGHADVLSALAAVNAPAGKVPIPFTPLVVNTGSKLVAIDTGTGGRLAPTSGTYMDNLAAAGIDPKTVDAIAISHFHPDHINGIRLKDDSLAFPNAEIFVPAPEWAFWMSDDNMNKAPEAARGGFMNARRVFKDAQERVKQFEPGKEIVPGINSVAAHGHTPGHTAYAISSGNQTLLTIVDATNIPALFVKNPGWHAVFDANPQQAEATRRKLLDMIATDKMLGTGYHWPFPGAAYVVKAGNGYDLIPAA